MSLGTKNSSINKKQHKHKRKQIEVWMDRKASGSCAICSLLLLAQEIEMT